MEVAEEVPEADSGVAGVNEATDEQNEKSRDDIESGQALQDYYEATKTQGRTRLSKHNIIFEYLDLEKKMNMLGRAKSNINVIQGARRQHEQHMDD